MGWHSACRFRLTTRALCCGRGVVIKWSRLCLPVAGNKKYSGLFGNKKYCLFLSRISIKATIALGTHHNILSTPCGLVIAGWILSDDGGTWHRSWFWSRGRKNNEEQATILTFIPTGKYYQSLFIRVSIGIDFVSYCDFWQIKDYGIF